LSSEISEIPEKQGASFTALITFKENFVKANRRLEQERRYFGKSLLRTDENVNA